MTQADRLDADFLAGIILWQVSKMVNRVLHSQCRIKICANRNPISGHTGCISVAITSGLFTQVVNAAEALRTREGQLGPTSFLIYVLVRPNAQAKHQDQAIYPINTFCRV